MNKRKHRRLQKPIKVLATSAILATTLFTPIMTNNLGIQADTVSAQTVNQYEQRVFDLPGTSSYQNEAQRNRSRQHQNNFMPTGLYVKPNEQVTIKVSGSQNIRAKIGSPVYDDFDNVWHEYVELSPGIHTISSKYGGLLRLDNFNDTGTVKVEVQQGGSPVPFFELGKHTKEDWIAMMNKYPNAPAVVLKSQKAVVTVSQDSAKRYIVDQNPIPLLEKYDKMIQAQDKISGLSETDPNPLHRTTRRSWAFTENPRLDYYGFSNTYETAAINKGVIRSVLDINTFGWGEMHEAGHARQQAPWTWGAVGEATVNIYSLAAFQQVNPLAQAPLEKVGGNGQSNYDAAFNYLKQTNKDYNTIGDDFVKLVMFWQLHLAYGQDFYPNLHKLYRELPNDQLPKTDDEKIQAFIYNTSKVAKQNVLPFFDQWGLKATSETRQKIEALNHPKLTAPIWESTDSEPINPALIPHKIVNATASSEQSGVNPASNAIDGNPDTIWHSQWSSPNQYPYSLTLDLGNTRTITKLGYLPRKAGENSSGDGTLNGRILNYKLYTSIDGINYNWILTGTWENSAGKKYAPFDPVSARYVKIEVLNGVNGFASAAEVNILGY